MIEVDDNNAAYYYHFDALGSVVALSDSTGDTVQTYEYSVYGEVSTSDPNHPNPYMFASRRFDIEVGFYYNRARYYNPYMGRFLQTDPIGYDDGINWYQYCRNNPLIFTDPSGTMLYPGHPAPPPLVSPDAPGYSRPWTVDRGKPDFADPWTANDFFNWYKYGNGEGITLSQVGLAEAFRNHPLVKSSLDAFQQRMIDRAKELCDTAQRANLLWSVDGYREDISYSLAGGSLLGLFRRLATGDPLVVMGDGTIQAEVYISVARTSLSENESGTTSTWEWTVQIVYSVYDWFSDPGNYMDKKEPTEWSGCTKYLISDSWNWQESGTHIVNVSKE